MGTLTESMTRLCGEIVTLRGARLTFVRDLGQDVAALKADFRRAHNEMAQRTKAERQGFVKVLGHEVASLMGSFHRAHAEMARKTKAERRAAVKHLKKTVGGMRRELSLDQAGAHRVWFGPSPAERRAKAEAERHAKAEAEQRAKAEAAQRAKQAAERDRLAALAMAKEEAVRHHATHAPKEEAGRPGKKKG
jgi:colicin import membrane protein